MESEELLCQDQAEELVAADSEADPVAEDLAVDQDPEDSVAVRDPEDLVRLITTIITIDLISDSSLSLASVDPITDIMADALAE
jgi:hypothetical protein